MRILQVAPPWFSVPPESYGGIELVVAGLADGLTAAGHDVTLLASGGSSTRAHLRSVYETPPSELLGDSLTELGHVLTAYVGEQRFDVVHDHTVLGAALGALHGATPVVHTVHGPWIPDLERIYGPLADRLALVALSHDHAGRAPSCVPIAGVVANGLPLERYPVGAHDGGYLAFLGRANPDKGPLVAIEVSRRLGLPLRMAIKVNEADERRYWDEVLVPALHGHDVEVLLGAGHDEKVALLGGAACLLVPIAWPEPFGLVMAEASACGTPVVAFARGSAVEVVVHERTGFLVAPDDVDGFCAAVEPARALDPAVCRRHAEERYSVAAMVEGYLAVYRDVLTTRRREIKLPEARRPAWG
jgi:glycosyltransferase involved in cell wall biosynthesis